MRALLDKVAVQHEPGLVAIRDDLTRAKARWENEGGATATGEAGETWRRAFLIEPLPPFRLDVSVWALRRRPKNNVDVWDGSTYRRVVVVSDATVELSITGVESDRGPLLEVTLIGDRRRLVGEEEVWPVVERLLGLHVDLTVFYGLAELDQVIGPIVTRFRGLKPPRFPTVFEALLNAVACQQLSLESGLSMLNRLASTYGEAVAAGTPFLNAFPTPQSLARLESSALHDLGFSRRKARTIIEIARAVDTGELDLEGLEHVSDAEAFALLTSLDGIGRWSAEYVLLRGLGRLNVFPGDDVGAQNGLARRLGLQAPLDYDAVGQAVSRWQPFAGLVYFHLLVDGLEARGALAAGETL